MRLEKSDYAPVFIPTLCRYKHFIRCVNSLSRCTGAEYTVLVIGLDYPQKEEHWEGYEKIKKYIPLISGFKDIIVLERPENYGAQKNGREGYKYIYEHYDRLILSEDDNEFSPNFLEFINKGLVKYKDDKNVVAVCGYMFPDTHIKIKGNAFLGMGYTAWGTGFWRNKPFVHHQEDPQVYVNSILSSWNKSLRIFVKEPKHLNSLITMYSRKLVWGDILISACCILENKGSLFPLISKVRNIGHDGSGLRCKKNNSLLEQVIDEDSHFDFSPENDVAHPICFSKYWKIGFLKSVVVLIRYICFRVLHCDILKLHYISCDV